jgi:DNA-binding NarL/FixJ family response regulator
VLNTCKGDAYFLKTNGFFELLKAIRTVMRGEIYLSPGLQVFPKDFHENGNKEFEDEFQQRHRLTPRETQILKLISLAMTYKEIADQLYISDQTVMVHKKNIMRKLNMSNTAGLIKFALDHNLS